MFYLTCFSQITASCGVSVTRRSFVSPLENKWTDFDADRHKRSTGQDHEIHQIWGQQVKGEGPTKLKID